MPQESPDIEVFVAPVSFAQGRLWLLDSLKPGLATYNVPLAARLRGPLDPRALAAALEEAVARHETLRTSFAEEDGEPVQRIFPALSVPLPRVDLGGLPADRREGEMLRQVRRDAAEPFDLGRAPLLRVLLFRLVEEEHVLFLNQHHIVTDAWSLGILLGELLTLHGAPNAALPELPIQYADFAVWQREQLRDEVLERMLAPWRRRLAGAPQDLPLPYDRPYREGTGDSGGTVSLDLPPDLAAWLRELSRESGTTLFMTLLAAFQALLSRLTGRADLVVGSPVAGRGRTETEGVIGFFVNTLALRGDLSGDPSFRQLLGRTREVVVEAFAHDDLPFEKLVEEVCPDRRGDRNPLFQAAFGFQPPAVSEMETGGLRVEPLEVHSGTAKFDLTLSLAETPDGGLRGFWEYASARFDPATVRRLSDHWLNLLADALAHPGRRLSELALLGAPDRHQLLAEWNDVRTSYPREATIPGLFLESASRNPEAPALVSKAGTVTYGELARRAGVLARRLRDAGVGPDEPVGVFLERGPEMAVAWLGALAAGGGYLPLDPAYPAERLAFMLEDGGVRALVTRREIAGRLPRHGAAVLFLEDGGEDGEDFPAGGAAPESLAYVVYTSGSTGKPKGVVVPHRAVVRLVRNTDYVQLGPDDRVAQVSNASFDAATFEVWGALLNGGALVEIERDVSLSPEDFAREIRERGVTALFLTTSLFNRVAGLAPAAFAPLRHLLVGGEAADPGRMAEVLAAGPPARLLNVYGPTEGTTYTTWHPVREAVSGSPVPLGRPLANTTVTVLDAAFRPVPIGAAGELCIGGDGLAHGYAGRPALTAERFIPRPEPLGEDASPGGRLYRTGDLARFRPDGAIEFLGRLDAQLKIRGFRVEPGEVEAALAAHPALAEAAVGARREESGELSLIAWIVPRQTPAPAAPSARDLRDFLADRLPEPMIPAVFVEIGALPRTPNGKVDRAALPDPQADGAPAGWAAPRTPVEEMLAGIWAEVLRLPPGRIGALDSFFELGGHSLTATAVTSLARSTFRIELATRTLFEHPVLADLAERVEELLRAGEGVELPPIVSELRPEDLPLSFSQQRLWFLDQLAGGETPYYNVAAAFTLTGRLDAGALERAASEVVRRHEALRTTFHEGPHGWPVQAVHPAGSWALPVADLGSLPPAAREAEALAIVRRETARPFSLAHGPLLRLELLRLEEERHALVLALHHVVSDGWSLDLFVRELAALYAAFATGRPSPLPELPVQYADFALWQRRWLGGSALDGQLGYWMRQLAGAPMVFELPTDRPRPAVQTYEGGSISIRLTPELAERLHALSRGHRVTLFMTLLGAFASLLERYTGRRDLLLGTPIANRNRAETAPLIGFFVNMLVLRAGTSGDPGFDALLARVRETALGAYAHQDLPFERLVEELQPVRDLSRHPVFQVAFAMGNAPWHALDLPGVELGFLGEGTGVELYDLTLQLTETGRELQARLSFNADLYDAATMRRLGRHLETLLASVADDPRRPAATVDLLSTEERSQLLEEWSGAIVPGPVAPAHELFAAQVRRRPDAPALVWRGAAISYEELDRRADRLARRFRDLGLGPERLVALLLPDAADFLPAALGAWKAGGAFLPLDPHWPAERLAWVIADSRAVALVARGPLAFPVDIPTVDLDVPEEAVRQPLEIDGDPDRLAYVIYTSGSTGAPKGVEVTHRAFALHILESIRLSGIGPGDRHLQASAFAADMALEQVFRPLLAGAAVFPWNPEVPGAAELTRELRGSGVSLMDLPTPLWSQAAAEWADGRSLPDLPALRWVLAGGEAMPLGALALWRRTPLAGVTLVNGYGPTEATVFTTLYQAGPDDQDPWRLHRLPIGRPVAPHAVYLLDDRGQPVPPGGIGEICVGGPAIARGYLGRPDLTAAAFVPDPFGAAPGARLYRTGDLARFLPDGNLDFLGRRDAQVKRLGYRIEPAEIEAALARHSKVRAAAVAPAMAAKEDGSGARPLAAWIVAVPGQEPSPAELREHLQRTLPPPMVPAFYPSIDALPLTTSGKVDRAALARRPIPAEAPEPAPAAVTPAEEGIAALWREVLGRGDVGLDDNFFDLGGHSMLIARMRVRLREAFGVDLETLELFNHPTVRLLARRVRREPALAAQSAALRPIPAPRRSEDVAIVGMAARLPGALDTGQLWRNLRDGVESITWFESGWTPPGGSYYRVPAHGNLEGAGRFDAPFFGCSVREAELMDPQHRQFLECAWEALEDAGYAPERSPGPVGVFAGASKIDYLARLFAAGVFNEPVGSQLGLQGTDRDNLPLRVSYKLGLEGPSVNVQTTCSTSLVAVHLACRSLLAGDCDLALAGGASIGANSEDGYLYRPGDVLSPDGHCRAFDAHAAGTVDADGVAAVVLKRLEDALADGDTIHAVIRGSGINNDGSDKVGFMAPRMATQSRLARSVLDRAGIPAGTISYVEAHGTATALGDPIEVAALTAAFRASTEARGFCALGSLKTNLGHVNAAAGAAGLIKAALALEHRQIPPTLHFESPNPEIDLAGSPFFVNTRLLDWEAPEGAPRRAAVNSFGIGGTNAHVVLEEAPARTVPEISEPHPWRLLVLSARSGPALDAAGSRLALHLERRPDLPLSDVAWTLQVGRRAFGHRRAVLCRDHDEAAASLGLLDPGRTASGTAAGRAPAVFLFPGQGAQRSGFGAGLYEAEPVFQEEIDRCAEILRPHLDRDIREVLFEAETEIDRTELTQPALFTLEWALARLWISWGVTPQALLGHSLGEYVAAALAGVFSLPDALALVAARGRLIGGLPGGAMLAVPLPPGELEPLLSEGLSLAAVNGPSRSVLSGPEEAVAALQERLARRGIAGKRLAVSHAFHSAMMDPILGAFAAEVRKVELRPPSIPFLSNLTGRWIEPGEATDPDYWVRHLRGTVRFAEGMAALLEDPARVYLEAGPGRSLANAARQVRPGQAASAVFAALPEPGETALPEPAWALLTLGRLWTAGVEVDWSALHASRPRRRVPLPTYPFEHRRYWVEIPESPDAPAAGPRVSEDSADWFHVPYWRPALPSGNGPSGPQLLFLDRAGLGRRLEHRLREQGIETVTVEPGESFARVGERSYVIHPGRAGDHEALFSDLGGRDLFPGEVVHLWNVDDPDGLDTAELFAFRSPLLLGHALAGAASRPVRVLLVSTGLHSVTGREAVEPSKGLLLAPCRVMPQRFTGLSCRAVDVELEPGMEEETVRLLHAETAAGGDEPVVAFRGRRRWAQDFTPQRLDLPGPADRFREGGVWVVTGGLGGVGYTLASLLHERCRARLVIVGRGLADPGSRAAGRLRSLEQRGAEVLLVAADVADPEAMREVRRRAEERFGAVHGILHAAGVPGPGMIDWSRPEAAAETLHAKVRGTLALAAAFDACEGAPLDLFVLCSSLSSLLGGIGQVGYAAGNAFLDAFAWSRSGDPNTLTVSIDWPLWRDAGFEAEAQGEHANRQRAASGLSSRQAVEAFQRILGYGFPQIAVSHIDVRDLMAAGRSWETSGFRAVRREGRTEETAAVPAPPQPRPASPATPMDEVEEAIAGVWRELLGVRDVSSTDDFFALGGDSLIALGLSARLHDRFRVELAPGDVYGAATLGELADLVRRQLATVTT